MFLSPNIFGQSDMVLWDVMIMMSGILEILTMSDQFGLLTMSDMFEFLIYTEEFWVQLWIVVKKHKRTDKGIS